jgi:hypothetical protein
MTPYILLIDNNLLKEAIKCNKHTIEARFLDLCATKLSNWEDYTPDDIEDVLESGYVRYGDGSITMAWF